jgi:hypothetical protein
MVVVVVPTVDNAPKPVLVPGVKVVTPAVVVEVPPKAACCSPELT